MEGRPFGVNFSGLDFLDAEEINGRFKFSIDVKSSSKRIYMPIFDRKKKIVIDIRKGNKILVQKSVLSPKKAESIQLISGSDHNGKVYLKGGISGISSGKVSISDKEKKLLETLGYI